MDMRWDFKVTGFAEYLRAVQSLQGAELKKGASKAMRSAVRAVLVPAMKRELSSDIARPGSHRGPKGKAGRTGPLASKVTVKVVRNRSRELVALSAGPRAWYRHFFLKGTGPHVIRAKNGRALLIGAGGTPRYEVQHPGSRGHSSVYRAARGQASNIQRRLASDMSRHVAQAGRTARSTR
jgi:hypothetical protein